ncbi:hypothetical protein EYF80_057290 [Liparis tanakae]|uniref:Uncharacterized protein n=1 Tax=Liparis tanakae TaxID=230148 RepID=A0A4Z2EVI4_9TELE|nr:hypothetical protein EYF80_057290 [Liparis tanakae]
MRCHCTLKKDDAQPDPTLYKYPSDDDLDRKSLSGPLGTQKTLKTVKKTLQPPDEAEWKRPADAAVPRPPSLKMVPIPAPR